jgi:hypothetical protein
MPLRSWQVSLDQAEYDRQQAARRAAFAADPIIASLEEFTRSAFGASNYGFLGNLAGFGADVDLSTITSGEEAYAAVVREAQRAIGRPLSVTDQMRIGMVTAMEWNRRMQEREARQGAEAVR